jgi:TPR repeat protein
MKKYLFCMTLLLSGAAYADDLADANALFAKKSYPQALQLYTKLANGGNAEAQLHMGEMYLYGEAGAVDVAKAESWFKKSAAKADLDFWMSKYDGAELKTGQYSCPAPRLPAMSKQNEEIAAVAAKVQAWQTCYNAFVVHLNAAAPLTKLIPKDVADLLTKDEMAVATSHLEGVYTSLVEEARVSSKLFLADYAAWRDATDAYVGNHNQMLNDAAAAAKQRKN